MSEQVVRDADGRAVGDLRLHPGDRLVIFDLHPRANWAHPCVYVIIAPDGQVRTAAHDWPPSEGTPHVFVSLPDAMAACPHGTSAPLRAYLALEGAMLALDLARDPLADKIRDTMDPLWDALTDEDRAQLNAGAARCPHGRPLDGDCDACSSPFDETTLCELDGYRVTASRRRTANAWLRLIVWVHAVDAAGRQGEWRIDPTAGVSLPRVAVDALRVLLTRPHGQASEATVALRLDATLAQEAGLWGVGGIVVAVSLRGHWYRVQAGSADAEGVRNAALTTSEIGVPDLRVGDLTSEEQASVLVALQAEVCPPTPWYEAPTATDDRDDAVRAEMRDGIPGKKEAP